VYGLAADDLAPRARIELGVPPNNLLAFGTILLDPRRGTLFVAESGVDRLYELDLDAAAVLRSWSLGGPLVTDNKEIGEVGLAFDPTQGALLIARSPDGRLQRFDPETDQLDTSFLPVEEAQSVEELRQVDLLRVFPDVAFYGGLAFDPTTLERLPERDLEVEVVVERATGGARWVGLVDGGTALVLATEGGGTTGRHPLAARPLHAVQMRAASDGSYYLYTRAADGLVCSLPADRL
jgi:DNA-binding beta-propeller fold protein YncE